MTNIENSKATGMGAPVRRVEDKRFLTGTGRFVDDLAPPRMAIACFVRSPHAHARILGIETTAAKSSPGVIAVLTGEDALRENLGHLECHSFPQSPPQSPPH